jgi:ATP-dependent Clp protease ATP-binding subunit ClpX
MDDFRCSFCGRPRRQVRKLISGPRVFICNDCVDQCGEMIDGDDFGGKLTDTVDRLSARWREEVVGQEGARLPLIHAFLRHLTRTRLHAPSQWGTPNQAILLTGPLGSGKTHLVETLAGLFGLPLVRFDGSRLREASPFPERDMWTALLEVAGRHEHQARRGVVCVERLDHLAASGPDDTVNLAAQEVLLSWLNGRPVAAPAEGGRRERIVLRTDRMLFVVSGVFGELAGGSLDDAALVGLGLLPEIVSRLGLRLSLGSLSADELRALLLRPASGPVAACVRRFAGQGRQVTFEAAAVEALVAEASRRLGGARAVESIVEAVAREISLVLAETGAASFVVTAEHIRTATRS